MRSVPTRFPCGDITLEGEWLFPDGEGPFPGVIICHPYPPGGGNMLNNVVTAIWQALCENSIAAFRFNFRGVGASEGSFGEGIAEREDVRAALDLVESTPGIDTGRIGLVGYSFGGVVALSVALEDKRVVRLAVVSSPLFDSSRGQLAGYDRPFLYVIGGADQMIPRDQVEQQIRDILNPEQYQVIPGADHSILGHEEEVARMVSQFFTAGFRQG